MLFHPNKIEILWPVLFIFKILQNFSNFFLIFIWDLVYNFRPLDLSKSFSILAQQKFMLCLLFLIHLFILIGG